MRTEQVKAESSGENDRISVSFANSKPSEGPRFQLDRYEPLLNPVTLTAEDRKKPVSTEAINKAQEQLDEGDRGGAYLTLYKELGNEQILAQAQITTYTGIWGSGALAGNSAAQDSAGERYNLALDQFSTDIAQSTIDGIREDLKKGGTGRLTDSQFRAIDRKVWKDKNMGELFPGNTQFWDPWNHKDDDKTAALSQGTINMAKVALRSALSLIGIKGGDYGRNTILEVGKRPAEFEGDPNFKIFGGKNDRFVTVIDKRTGHVEAFWDCKPKFGALPAPQLKNQAPDKESPEFKQRSILYSKLGANQRALDQVKRGESNPTVSPDIGWLLA